MIDGTGEDLQILFLAIQLDIFQLYSWVHYLKQGVLIIIYFTKQLFELQLMQANNKYSLEDMLEGSRHGSGVIQQSS